MDSVKSDSVNPYMTSQIDHSTGQIGVRNGIRFYSDDLVYDADINAAINIAKLSKLPILQGNPLDGQAIVNKPIVGFIPTSPIL